MHIITFNGWAAKEAAWEHCKFARQDNCKIYSYTEQLQYLEEKRDFLEGFDEDIVLVGWSMGSVTAIRLASENPDRVKGLVLIAGTPRLFKDPNDKNWRGMSELRLRAMKMGLTSAVHKNLIAQEDAFAHAYNPDDIYDSKDEASLDAGLEFLRVSDCRDCLENFPKDIPVWIFQSEKDAIVPKSHAEYMKSKIPQAKVVMVPGNEHALMQTLFASIDEVVVGASAHGVTA